MMARVCGRLRQVPARALSSIEPREMKPTGVDIDAPILPNHSLGGIRLRSRAVDLQEVLLCAHGCHLATHFEARYVFEYMSIAIDVRNGRVFKLIAGMGYRGTLFGRIRTGMSLAQAMALEPRLRYDEFEETVVCRGIEGVCLDLPRVLPSVDDAPAAPIESICVYATEILSAPGQDGKY